MLIDFYHRGMAQDVGEVHEFREVNSFSFSSPLPGKFVQKLFTIADLVDSEEGFAFEPPCWDYVW